LKGAGLVKEGGGGGGGGLPDVLKEILSVMFDYGWRVDVRMGFTKGY